ncbi:hypothetical protein PI125_g21655 [Phytophthora idaei]|nr:hypothetical protein PI125_g21655 [Phytophthora idaei]
MPCRNGEHSVPRIRSLNATILYAPPLTARYKENRLDPNVITNDLDEAQSCQLSTEPSSQRPNRPVARPLTLNALHWPLTPRCRLAPLRVLRTRGRSLGAEPSARTSLEPCSQQFDGSSSVCRVDNGAQGGNPPQRALALVQCAILERWALARCQDVTEALVLLNAEKTFGRGPDAGCAASKMRDRQ